MADPIKQDGSVTGLRVAQEASFGVLPGTPNWVKMEPNRYGGDFGPKIGTTERDIIVANRQNEAGVVSDLDANGSFEMDLTQGANFLDLLVPGFFFADWQDKPSSMMRAGTAIALTAVDTTSDEFQAASGLDGLGFVVNHLLKASGLADAANNGVHVVDSVASGAIGVTTNLTSDGSPVAGSKIEAVGYQFPSATIDVVVASNVTTLTRVSGAIDYTTIGLAPGDWIFIGGDTAVTRYQTTGTDATGRTVRVNNGWVRVRSVSAAGIVLDLTQYTMVNETGAADAATATLTATSIPLNNETVTIGAKTYTFKTALTGAANEILIGADLAAALLNLQYGVNDSGGVEGTNYGTGTTANASATAVAAATTVVFTAITPGVAGNSIVSTETGTTISFGGATFSGGADAMTIRIFFGHKITNAPDEDDIVRRTYQLERTLGADDTAAPADKQSEYIEGAVPNVLDMKIPLTSKISMDLAFVGKDHTTRTGAEGLKSGTRPSLTSSSAFGTSSDARRMKMHIIDTATSNPGALFAYLREINFNINNNVTPNKAVTVLGAFEMSTGQFDVTGSMTAYFAKNSALAAIRQNRTVALNAQLARDNKGMVFDIPSAKLQGGPPNVEKNAPIMLPLTYKAFRDAVLDYTFAVFEFPYLPSAAETPIAVS